MKVSIDGLADAIIKELNQYEGQVIVETKRAVEKVAEECRKDIMNNASAINGTKYAKSWKKKLVYSSAKQNRYTVYSTKYQLTHLLEYGHEKWLWGYYTGSRVGPAAHGRPHIRPAEVKAEANLINELKRKLS